MRGFVVGPNIIMKVMVTMERLNMAHKGEEA